MKFLVIGGTGRIGSKVVERLRVAGHEIVVAAPSTGVDVLTGEGLMPPWTASTWWWTWPTRPRSKMRLCFRSS